MRKIIGTGRWEGWTLWVDAQGRIVRTELTEPARERNDAYCEAYELREPIWSRLDGIISSFPHFSFALFYRLIYSGHVSNWPRPEVEAGEK